MRGQYYLGLFNTVLEIDFRKVLLAFRHDWGTGLAECETERLLFWPKE